MADSPKSDLIVEEHPEPGVLRQITSATNPGLTMQVLSADEWERRTGMGDHVSLSFGSTQNTPPTHAGSSVACPACKGVGIVGEIVGMAATCVFCVGAGTVTSAEARRYDRDDPLSGAEPTLRRLKILIHQLDPTGVKYLYQYRLDPNRIRYPYRLTYSYLRARMWLDHYEFTLERLQAELDEDDLNGQLDDLWGFDGRQYAGEDFRAGSPTGSGNERWDECDFSGSILTGANFHEVDLTDSIFNAADLAKANLSAAKLTRVSFRDADLSGANLNTANVTGADFRGVKGLSADALVDLRRRGAVVDEPAS